MPPIDDKVVAMSFESSKFEQGVNNTISALDRLKAALHFPNAGKGLSDIDAAAKKVDLSHIGRAVDDIKNKFSALSVAGLAVISNLAIKAASAGANFVKAFTLDPVKAGFTEYATNLNAVQTILANTQASGAKLADVNAALKQLNDYSDKTIYNFSQMAKNIGTFTAAGVDLDTATGAIKGIANLAALSGSSAEQASTAMYQLSQAISAGRVSLQDWNSVVNAGMGGTVFQRALAQTAEAMGTLKDGTVKLVGPMKNVTIAGETFRQSLQAGPGKASWLTSGVLTKTLEQFTGDLSNAQLKAEGFNDAQIKAIQQTAKTAMHAATEVKTLSQVLDVAKETAGSGWAQTWQIIFGDFGEAKKTFTDLSNTINGFINANADARNKILKDWKDLGGRTVLIDAIRTAFENLGKIIAPIKEAFRDIFPAATGKSLYDLTVRFKELADALEPSPQTVENLRRTFAGFFAILDIGRQVLGEIFGVFGRLFSSISNGQGNFLGITAAVGDFLVSVDEALKKGDGLHNFFTSLGDILLVPIDLLKQLASALADLFSGFSSGGISGQFKGLGDAATPLQRILEGLSTAWSNFVDNITNGQGLLQAALNGLVSLIQGLGPAINAALSNMNFEAILQVIRTGLFGGIFLLFKDFLGKGSFAEQLAGAGGGILKNIAGSFDALRGSMEAMQTNIKAKTLKEIAIAIGILAASVVALSFVDPEKLKSSITAIAFMAGELVGAMALLNKIGGAGAFIKLPVMATGLIALAGAIDILAIAVFALSKLDWEELAKGLTGVGALLAGVSVAAIPLSANAAGMIRAGIGITAISVGMNILALAMKQLSGLSWTQMAKGLSGVAGGLTAVAVASKAMPKGMVAMGAGVIAIAVGMKILADAIAKFSGMSWKEIGKGLAAVGGGLVIIAAAMNLMPTSTAITAAGLLLVALALGKIVSAIQSMGGMSISEIAKGLVTLAGALGILAAAMYVMTGTLAGAAALAVAATGISLLASALVKMGGMSWGEILKSLVELAAALTLIGVAGVALTPVIPSLLGLGAALVLIGGGLALAGAGVALVGVGLSAIAVAGPTAIGVLVKALSDLEQAAIDTAKNLVLGLLEIVDALAKTAPKFVDALVKIINALLDVVIKSSPKIAEAFTALINAALKVLHDNQGKIIQAGFDLIVALLQGIKNNLPKIIDIVADIIVAFLQGITRNINKIVDAGSDLLVALLKGIARHISNVATSVIDIIVKFLETIASNLPRIVSAGADIVISLIEGISRKYGDIIRAGTDAVVSFIEGIGNSATRVMTAGVDTAIAFINALVEQSLKLVDAGAQAIVNFLNGVADAINKYEPQMLAAGARIGVAIVQGMINGLGQLAGSLYSKVAGIVQHAKDLATHPWKIFSPSQVTEEIGKNIILGFVKGIEGHEDKFYASMEGMSYGLIQSIKDIFEIRSPSQVMVEIGKEVGRGFAVGLRGSAEDINRAFQDMNDLLAKSMQDAHETIISEQKKLDDERQKLSEQRAKLAKEQADKKPDAATIKSILADIKDTEDTIREIQGVITENEDILSRTSAAHKVMIGVLKDEKNELARLANEYDRVSTKLDEATQALEDARRARDEAVKATTAQYGALPELDTTSKEEIAAARKQIKDEQDRLDEVKKQRAKDIADQRTEIARTQDDMSRMEDQTSETFINATQKLADQKAALGELMSAQGKSAQGITDQQASVAKAQADLAELLKGKTLDSLGNSVDQLATYEDALKHQTTAVGAYNATLQQLRKLGLDDATYQKLVDEGVADQAFAKQLLAGGKGAVDKLNKLDKNLQTVSKRLGTNVGQNMFQAGVDAARGIVDGLDQKKSDIYKKMREIGNEMVEQLKRELKIKSPSEVFAEIGAQSMEGFVMGFEDSSHLIVYATDQVAKDAVSAMQRSMRAISGAVLDELSPNPVITPILDLSVVQAQSRELAALTNVSPTVSYTQAALISAQQSATLMEEPTAPVPGASFTFEQNNYSPEALSEVEIYRQTRNQLSQLRSALAQT